MLLRKANESDPRFDLLVQKPSVNEIHLVITLLKVLRAPFCGELILLTTMSTNGGVS